MNQTIKTFTIIFSILYPVTILISLHFYSASPKTMSLIFLAFGFIYFITHTNNKKKGKLQLVQFWFMTSAITALGILGFFTNSFSYLQLYPILVNLVFLTMFTYTLFSSPNMVFRFAVLQDKSILESPKKDSINRYCRKVTIVWITFFIINCLISLSTSIWGDIYIWTLYNGVISYILMGLIFGIEFIIRKSLKVS